MTPATPNSMGTRRDISPGRPNVDSAIRARNIMTTDVVAVQRGTTIHQVAQLLRDKHISAVAVLEKGSLVGIVSEADLLQRPELGTTPHAATSGNPSSAAEAALQAALGKAHGGCAGDVMTCNVVTLPEEASLAEVVEVLQARRLKRVMITRGERLVGLVSRSDIMRALAARPEGAGEPASSDDDVIRYRVIETLLDMPGTSPWATIVSVLHGVVELGGSIEDEARRGASHAAIENLPNVVAVKDGRSVVQPYF